MNDPRKKVKKPLTIDQKINRRNFIAFGSFTLLSAAAYSGWRHLYQSPLEKPGVTAGARQPLRKALSKTELFFRRLYSNNNLVKTYPKSMAAKVVRVNSRIGLRDSGFKPEEWKLRVKGGKEELSISLEEIKALPKTEIIFDFKCVEGWDQISHWGGVKFIDLIEHFNLQSLTQMQYVGLNTPDNKYFVGLDMPSALHPQTILAYEVNDKPLPDVHGYPLRLIIPVKYGIKNIKRIATITFSDSRPPDYWAQRGYDYYSGL
ncbi:MAG: molybdopterin-binding oxidoreductase [Sphingobacteriaceae bacterium]|nr:MAG: molybdopterin-binding oxidoreductase [Sphingobacteriaceae bacterium]